MVQIEINIVSVTNLKIFYSEISLLLFIGRFPRSFHFLIFCPSQNILYLIFFYFTDRHLGYLVVLCGAGVFVADVVADFCIIFGDWRPFKFFFCNFEF